MAEGLSARGLHVVTFNFLYTERGRKLPDPQPLLESCFRAVLHHAAADPLAGVLPLFIGGKSMGGRMASHVAASRDAGDESPRAWWTALRGLVFLGYPLHSPARPQQVRVSHLARVDRPMLFVQGEKDAFGTPAELRPFLDVLPAPCTLHAVAQAGHSLDVLKRSGLSQQSILDEVMDVIAGWIRRTCDAAATA
jgi:predicted alpha/beta-hydrolase family hydrolase